MAALKEYAVYKGDKLLGIGTADELAKLLNVKRESIIYLKSPSYRRRLEARNCRNARTIVFLDDGEEEE